MGNICGVYQDNKSELKNLNKEYLQKYLENDNLTKVKAIQNQFRTSKSIKKLNEEKLSYEIVFDTNLKTIGKIISDKELEEYIDKEVTEIDKLLGPVTTDIDYLEKYKNIFSKPSIKFTEEGTIYKGQWNFNGKKHGYGILITKEGCKYEGFWKNDQLDGKGRFIEKRGNYYDGIKLL